MNKLFTLIELIVVIAVLGILAAIIIPNISSFQEEANTTAIVSNVRSLQTGVDMYSLDNYSSVPTIGGQPTEFEPKPIDFDSMIPDYSRDLPETEGVKYWVDGWGKVWASSIDSPTNVDLTSTTLKWDSVDGADMYKVYKVLNPSNTSSLLNADTELVFYKEATKNENTNFPVDDSNVRYAVSAVDNNKFESAPAGTGYTGYKNEIPTASMSLTPSTNLKTDTIISWGYSGSTDPDGDSIVSAEWTVNGNPVAIPPATFTAGNHTIKLRVKDSKGNWSEWKSRTITVEEAKIVIEAPAGEYLSLVPTLSSNNSSELTISASKWTSWLSVSYQPYKAFDGKADISENGWMPNSYGNEWLEVDFVVPQKVERVGLYQGVHIYDIEYRAKNFEIKYFDEQSNTWKSAATSVLAQRTGEQQYNLSNVGEHKKWRLYIYDHHYTGSAYIGIGEWKLYSSYKNR